MRAGRPDTAPVTRPAVSPEAIERATGIAWADWLAYFDSLGGAERSHRELVAAATHHGAPPWWGQMVTVAYEQHIGRRAAGQVGDGTFNVSVTRTVAGTMDETLARWLALTAGRDEFGDVAVVRGPETSESERWRYWRCCLGDGSRLVVNVSDKPAAAGPKSSISVQHELLDSPEHVEHWRAYWRAFVRDL